MCAVAFGSESDPNSNCSSLVCSASLSNSSYLQHRDKCISWTCRRREDSYHTASVLEMNIKNISFHSVDVHLVLYLEDPLYNIAYEQFD